MSMKSDNYNDNNQFSVGRAKSGAGGPRTAASM